MELQQFKFSYLENTSDGFFMSLILAVHLSQAQIL